MGKRTLRDKISYATYRFIRFAATVIYHRPKVTGADLLPDSPCIVVGNHTKMNGPICGVLYYPRSQKVWCIGEMMDSKEVPAYAFQDFWGQKPKILQPFYKLLSHIIAFPAEALMVNAPTIGVYHDSRVLNTYRDSVTALTEGHDVIIFPECPEPGNHIVNKFQEGFVDVARLYCRRTKKPVSFVPLYNAPTIHVMALGEPVWFDPEAPIKEERDRICRVLTERITAMAEALPEHTVVPYTNVSKRHYHSSRIASDSASEVK